MTRVKRDPRSSGSELLPSVFLGHPLQPQHLSIKSVHRIHLPGKKDHPRHLH
jgi:hypothetical protein